MADAESHGQVSIAKQKTTVKLFNEAGEAGLARQQLAKAAGLSIRGVDRVLEALREQGAIIEAFHHEGERKAWYRLKKGPKWDRRISVEMRLALKVASLALSASGTHQWNGILNTLGEMAEAEMTLADRQAFTRLTHAVKLAGEAEAKIEQERVLEPLLRAIECQSLVQLDYLKPGSKGPEQLRVVPHALVHDLFAGSAFLVAYDPNGGHAKTLRLNRIMKLGAVGRGNLRQAAQEMVELCAKYQVGGWGGSEAPFDVVVHIHGAHWIQAIKDAPPALPEFHSEIGQGMLIAHFKANHKMGVLRWVLQFGLDAELISPPWIREELKNIARSMTVKYE